MGMFEALHHSQKPTPLVYTSMTENTIPLPAPNYPKNLCDIGSISLWN